MSKWNVAMYERISNVVDVETMQNSRVALIGAGGSFVLGCNMIRNGLGSIVLVDFDIVESSNIARQGHSSDQIGEPKVKALAANLHAINPATQVQYQVADFTGLSDEQIDSTFGECDLFIFGTDSFACQARGNEVALRLNTPAMWIGLYAGGLAGEVIWWTPERLSCFRCLCQKRYEAQADVLSGKVSAAASSQGATVFDIALVDAIAGQIAVGLLTQGADNRFGRLIEQLGNRQFIQIGIDPEWRLNGRDVVREQLGVAEETTTLFAWNSIARNDPDNGFPPCPDCRRFRERTDDVPRFIM